MSVVKYNLSAEEVSLRRIAPIWLTAIGSYLFSFKKRVNKPQRINKILLFKIGAIGDTLLTTPLVRSLRQRYPDVVIEYAVGAWSASALKDNADIDRVIPFADEIVLNKRVGSFLKLIKKLRRNHYDVVLVLDRAWQAGVIGALIGGYTVGFDRFGEGFALNYTIPYGVEPHNKAPHDIDMYLALGQHLDCGTSDRAMVISSSEQDRKLATRLLENIPTDSLKVALCPGGADNPYQQMAERRWLPKYYAELMDNLFAQQATIIIVGGKQDNKVVQKVLKSLRGQFDKHQFINLIGQTTLNEAAAVIAKTDIAVMHDTALMHVASAVQTPTIALFGPTNPNRKKPLGEEHQVIWNNSACSSVEKEKQPCYWENSLLHADNQKCMSTITVLDVLNIINVKITTI
jgi:lipopolysaccharide heptosyltransferase II